MRVIFIQNVKKQGRIDEVKDMNEGYARNFLFPNKLAVEATPKALAELAERQKGREAKAVKYSKEFQAALEKLSDFTLVIKKRANADGQLFSGVTIKEILSLLREQGINFEDKNFDLKSPIKKAGKYELPIIGASGNSLKISIESE